MLFFAGKIVLDLCNDFLLFMTKLLHILLFIQNLDASKEKIISLKIPVQIV